MVTGLARFFALSVLAGLVAAAGVVGTGALVAHAEEPVPVVEVTVAPSPEPEPVEGAGPVVVRLDDTQMTVITLGLGILVIAASAAFVTSVGGRRA